MLWGLRPTVSPLTAISQDFIAQLKLVNKFGNLNSMMIMSDTISTFYNFVTFKLSNFFNLIFTLFTLGVIYSF